MIEPLRRDEALLADLRHRSRRPDRSGFRLWWLGQSGYFLVFGAQRILIDPYLSDTLSAKYADTATPHVRISPRVIDPAKLPRVDLITSSHNHTDHLDAATLLPVLEKSPSAKVVLPEANREFAANRLGVSMARLTGADDGQCLRVGSVEIWPVPAAHPSVDRDALGHCRHLGYVFRAHGWSIYHSGDTMADDAIVERMPQFPIDLAILPINGKLGNMDATAAANFAGRIGARLTIPCHYDLFEFNTASPIAFESAAAARGIRTRVLRMGESFASKEITR